MRLKNSTARDRVTSVSFALVALSVAFMSLAACGSESAGGSASSGAPSITVATSNFTETKILANMYQQILVKNGVKADVRELTNREVIIPALERGDIQATPEYLGSLTEYLNRSANGPAAPRVATGNLSDTYAAAQKLALPKELTLLTPSPAQNQNAFAVTAEFAGKNGIRTLSELSAWSQTHELTLGGPPECPTRPFCEPGLQETYGMKVNRFVPLDVGGPLTVEAITEGTVTTGLMLSSAGSLQNNNLVLLTDDKSLQTAENLTPVLYTPAVTQPISEALNSVSAALTTAELQQLNQRVEIDGKEPKRVATEFLKSKGLL